MDKDRREKHNTAHIAMFEKLKDCAKLLGSKGHDYGMDNLYDGGKIATILVGHEIDATTVAACLIGVKMSRYGVLVGGDKKPKHESVEDTTSDLVNYILLMERERKADVIEKGESTG